MKNKLEQEKRKYLLMKGMKVAVKKNCESKKLKELIKDKNNPMINEKDLKRAEVLIKILNLGKIDKKRIMYTGIELTFQEIIEEAENLKEKFKRLSQEIQFPHKITLVDDDKLFSVYKRITETFLEGKIKYHEFKGDSNPDANYRYFYNRYLAKKSGKIDRRTYVADFMTDMFLDYRAESKYSLFLNS